ncbi:hypothetical protein ABVT39_027158 [Epinephelus coioides]
MADMGTAIYPIHTGCPYRKLVCVCIIHRKRLGRRQRRRQREECKQYMHD